MSELAERAHNIAAAARVRAQSRRDDNRAAMPLFTAFVDDLRTRFGIAGGRATENGRTVQWGELLTGTAVQASVSHRRKR
jgi:hypothetical protein